MCVCEFLVVWRVVTTVVMAFLVCAVVDRLINGVVVFEHSNQFR